MKTTLDIDDDVLRDVRKLAKSQKKRTENLLAELLRNELVRRGLIATIKRKNSR